MVAEAADACLGGMSEVAACKAMTGHQGGEAMEPGGMVEEVELEGAVVSMLDAGQVLVGIAVEEGLKAAVVAADMAVVGPRSAAGLVEENRFLEQAWMELKEPGAAGLGK